eukprot:TRINITY_DN1697_c0_g1_i1.p1 TRINITY_DN1697_c0_g1~~TRINITY_DN1697_c0_g1_i1.p1  ORF type:complete len:698 (+),score=185.82 TRINITY_DN1697_c0_g1_i1:104-2197(+)
MNTMQGSVVQSKTSGGTAGILPAERSKASFDVEKMTNVIDGGVDKTKRRRFILSPVKDMSYPDKHTWDRATAIKNHVKHFIQSHENYWDSFIPTREDVAWMMENAMLSGALMNHYGLFLATIVGQGNDEQKINFGFPAMQMQIVGCYAQTELGHGSNVRGLQTVAIYDKNTQEFVLDTPTLLSIKWWPGALGKVATHAVVYAQMMIEGKEYGVQPFILQIRDENHKPLPGIELGELGEKLGDHANDTGFMILDKVRIPRTFLLSRTQEVQPDGTYIQSELKAKNNKLHYATMMYSRGAMIKGSSGYLARASTIAIRYSCVRKQGYLKNTRGMSFKSEERQIIDYQVQQYRLFKQLALTYAIKFTGKWMLNKFADLEGTPEQKEKEGAWIIQNIEALPEIAATSAGLKALCTYLVSQGIEDLRKCCGGNGYLMAGGLAPLAADFVWQTTAEGDWILLMLQTGKHILSGYQKAKQGTKVGTAVDYLAPFRENPNSSRKSPIAKSTRDFFDENFLLEIFKHNALVAVVNAGNEFDKRHTGDNYDEAWNECSLSWVEAVRAHCYAFMMFNFLQEVKEVSDKSCRDALTRVYVMFALSTMLDDPTFHLPRDQRLLAKEACDQVMLSIRPDAVALVDAFDISDNVLNSVLGRHDGNVYEALFESAKNSPLNKTDPFDGYKEYLRPHLNVEFLKQGNSVPSSKL